MFNETLISHSLSLKCL